MGDLDGRHARRLVPVEREQTGLAEPLDGRTGVGVGRQRRESDAPPGALHTLAHVHQLSEQGSRRGPTLVGEVLVHILGAAGDGSVDTPRGGVVVDRELFTGSAVEQLGECVLEEAAARRAVQRRPG